MIIKKCKNGCRSLIVQRICSNCVPGWTRIWDQEGQILATGHIDSLAFPVHYSLSHPFVIGMTEQNSLHKTLQEKPPFCSASSTTWPEVNSQKQEKSFCFSTGLVPNPTVLQEQSFLGQGGNRPVENSRLVSNFSNDLHFSGVSARQQTSLMQVRTTDSRLQIEKDSTLQWVRLPL